MASRVHGSDPFDVFLQILNSLLLTQKWKKITHKIYLIITLQQPMALILLCFQFKILNLTTFVNSIKMLMVLSFF